MYLHQFLYFILSFCGSKIWFTGISREMIRRARTTRHCSIPPDFPSENGRARLPWRCFPVLPCDHKRKAGMDRQPAHSSFSTRETGPFRRYFFCKQSRLHKCRPKRKAFNRPQHHVCFCESGGGQFTVGNSIRHHMKGRSDHHTLNERMTAEDAVCQKHRTGGGFSILTAAFVNAHKVVRLKQIPVLFGGGLSEMRRRPICTSASPVYLKKDVRGRHG